DLSMALFRLTTSSSAWARSGSEAQSAEDASSVTRTLVIASRSNVSLDVAPRISFYVAEPSSTVQLKQTRRSETMTCVRVGSQPDADSAADDPADSSPCCPRRIDSEEIARRVAPISGPASPGRLGGVYSALRVTLMGDQT